MNVPRPPHNKPAARVRPWDRTAQRMRELLTHPDPRMREAARRWLRIHEDPGA